MFDIHEKSSHSSRFASQISKHLLGASFDRSFLSPHGQIQRCPSLEFGTNGYDDKILNSSQDNEMDDDGSCNYLQSLRSMMTSREMLSSRTTVSPDLVPQPEPGFVNADLNMNRHGPKHGIGVFSGQRRTIAGQGSGDSGGIGGALAQYRAKRRFQRATQKKSTTLDKQHRTARYFLLHLEVWDKLGTVLQSGFFRFYSLRCRVRREWTRRLIQVGTSSVFAAPKDWMAIVHLKLLLSPYRSLAVSQPRNLDCKK